jgi:hypothetical protein
MFVPLYNMMNADREDGASLEEFFSSEEAMTRYLSTNAEVGSQKEAGRIDVLVIPVKSIAKDPVSLAFGYGLGNVSDSALGPEFSGYHNSRLGMFIGTTFSRVVLELGILGVTLLLLTYWLILQDCRVVARTGGFIGALAAGWMGVVALFVAVTFYAKIELSPGLAFLFCYFSGLIAAQRMRLATAKDPGGQIAVPLASFRNPAVL